MDHLFAQNSGTPLQGPTVLQLDRPQAQGAVTVFQARWVVRIPVAAGVTQLNLAGQAALSVQFEALAFGLGLGNTALDAAWYRSPPAAISANEYAFHLMPPVRLDHLSSTAFTRAELHRMDGASKVDHPSVNTPMGSVIADEFVASRFVVSLFDAPANAQPGNRVSLHMVGRPTSPRIKLSTTDASETLWQWLAFPGEQTQSRTATINATAWQSALARALALHQAGKLPGGSASEIVLHLDVISDAPCRLTLTPTALAFAQEVPMASALPGAADGGHSQGASTDAGGPVTLRFDGQREQCQLIELRKPAAAASRIQLDLRVSPGDASAAPLPSVAAMGQRGFALQGGDWLARPWPVPTASFVSALALPWWPLEGGATLTLSLHAEQAGQAADAAMAQATLSASGEAAGQGPQWLIFRWPEQPLQPGAYWLKLAVKQGSGLWLAQAQGTQDITVTRQSAEQAHQHVLTPLTPVAQALAAAGPQVAPMRCSLNGVALSLARADVAQPGHWLAELGTLPASLQSAPNWMLSVCSEAQLLVTLQDAHVVGA
jgi:hypothetical protein